MKVEKPKKEVSIGDVWKLGDHRLFCGDSREPGAILQATGGAKVRMILTDPPYGVDYSDAESLKFKKINIAWEQIKGDQLQTEKQYEEFTKMWAGHAIGCLEKYNTIYVFISDMMLCPLKSGLSKSGFYVSQLIIWVKSSPVMGRKDYLAQHELITYGWHGRHKAEKGKSKSVVFCPKPAKSRLHPTMKPLSLLRKLILNSTKIGEWVYDPFGGSGSTLIASEHTRRKCAIIELSTEYCSTIIQRWESITGKEAIKQ